MSELARFAAIDIGSNAVRLLVAATEADSPRPKNDLLFRMPLRLGAEAFSSGRLSAPTVDRLVDVMGGFALLLRALDIAGLRACATSALRSATNRDAVVRAVHERCGVAIETLSGRKEVALLCANFRDSQGGALAVDVGGGSTELALLSDGEPQDMRSFDLGTVRALVDGQCADGMAGMTAWLAERASAWPELSVHGSGGNVRKLGKLVGHNERIGKKPLAELAEAMAATSLAERMRRWSMPEERADTILPAARIFLAVMDATKRDSMHVSKLGLADAMIREMAERHALGDARRTADDARPATPAPTALDA